jgi:hypothetical protein
MSDSAAERAEFERECKRVGVTWNAFVEWERLNASGGPPSPDGSISFSGGLPALTAMLRPLPDAIGDAGFLEAMAKKGELLRAQALEATRRTEAPRRARGPSSGGAGA